MIQVVSLCLIRKCFLKWAHHIPTLLSWPPSTPSLKDTLASKCSTASQKFFTTEYSWHQVQVQILRLLYSLCPVANFRLDVLYATKPQSNPDLLSIMSQVWFSWWLCGVCESGPYSRGVRVHLVFLGHLFSSPRADHSGYYGSSTRGWRSFLPNIL